jgi:hypothetical protein
VEIGIPPAKLSVAAHRLSGTRTAAWPDYGPGPLWTDEGKPADLTTLPIGDDLVERLTIWTAANSEDKVPSEGAGDEAWLSEGEDLLDGVRSALEGQHQVVVTEPWWGEEPT